MEGWETGRVREGSVQLCLKINCFSVTEMMGDCEYWRKLHQIYQKYYSKLLYKHIQSLLACLFMQTAFYANKTEKKMKANHLRENEQLMHIEYKNPYEFFYFSEVRKGHWILWRLIPFLKIPIPPDAIKLFLQMTTDTISEPNAVLCICQSCKSLS